MGENLFKNYKHWRIDGQKILLSDYEKRIVLGIEHNRLVLEYDIPNSIEDFKHKLNLAYREYTKHIDIVDYRRFGMRSQCFMPVEFEFSELVKLTRNKFIPQDEALMKMIGANVEDYQFNINSELKDFKIHMHCGPIRKEEIPRWFTPTVVSHDKDQKPKEIEFPEVAFFSDLDCFVDKPNRNDLEKFIDESIKFLFFFNNEMSEYLKG